jgi:hypothetical protein
MELTASHHLGLQSLLSSCLAAAQPGQRTGVLVSWHFCVLEAPGEGLLPPSWQHTQGVAQAPGPTAKLPRTLSQHTASAHCIHTARVRVRPGAFSSWRPQRCCVMCAVFELVIRYAEPQREHHKVSQATIISMCVAGVNSCICHRLCLDDVVCSNGLPGWHSGVLVPWVSWRPLGMGIKGMVAEN